MQISGLKITAVLCTVVLFFFSPVEKDNRGTLFRLIRRNRLPCKDMLCKATAYCGRRVL